MVQIVSNGIASTINGPNILNCSNNGSIFQINIVGLNNGAQIQEFNIHLEALKVSNSPRNISYCKPPLNLPSEN